LSTDAREITIVIEDAPLLERFLKLEHFIGSRIHVTVISAPKLETLGGISDCDSDAQLVFDNTVIQVTIVYPLSINAFLLIKRMA
jgi:hypothetical protein